LDGSVLVPNQLEDGRHYVFRHQIAPSRGLAGIVACR
jgi:hypothetical protein